MNNDSNHRYDRDYTEGNITFHLADYTPDIEECRFLILKVVEQAVRDLVLLFDSVLPNELLLWETARLFLFDDSTRISWGDLELSLEDLLNIVDIDTNWFREQVAQRFKKKYGVSVYG